MFLPQGLTTCPSCGTLVSAGSPAYLPALPVQAQTSNSTAMIGTQASEARNLPNQPSAPLFPGETIVARFNSYPPGVGQIRRLNMRLFFVGFAAFTAVAALGLYFVMGVFALVLLVLCGFWIAVFRMVGASGARKAERAPPTVAFVTDRRVIIDSPGPPPSSSSIELENLGDVTLYQGTSAARRAGVFWIYLVPVGTASALNGVGRYRTLSPGVVWIGSMKPEQAQALKSVALQQARNRRAALGFPNSSPAS